jgi:hypothetical protein
VSSWFMAGMHTRRTLEHWTPDDGPLEDWLDGWRYQAFATNTTPRAAGGSRRLSTAHAKLKQGRRPDPARRRHRRGSATVPRITINQAWLTCVALAVDLTAPQRRAALRHTPYGEISSQPAGASPTLPSPNP